MLRRDSERTKSAPSRRASLSRQPALQDRSSRGSQAANSSSTSTRDAQLQEIRHELERQRAELLEEAGVGFVQQSKTPAFPDVSDQATAEADQHFAMRIRERERKLIKKIDEALSRIAAGTYGICEVCGEEIPFPRLKARPVTTLCIECKTRQEEQENGRR
ncbi:putative RNA polymerase-binding protein DksA [Nitrospira tepida]|uniref:RNA polymerase-binding protein DksA n=1 Tax=Nitrospira tepida TaxID=2973512 RepID=A0AA86MVX7_9BACT|nr:RNA polymerase-binding protein DksA [Nitrospira tepida]CAI4030015.1 putative RNA polymerase-binding protein DksA [Nitrospira tepida]